MQDLIILHGALGSAAQMYPLAEKFSKDFNVHTFSFSGHGGEPFSNGFGIDTFAKELSHYISQHCHSIPLIIGYSMGGYVALALEKSKPNSCKAIVTIATKFDWSPEASEKEIKLLNPDIITQKVPKFAEALQKRHAPNDWVDLLESTKKMMIELGNSPTLLPSHLAEIQTPVMCCVGDVDEMITLNETIQAYQNIPNSHLFVMPQQRHAIEKLNLDLFVESVSGFLSMME